MSYNSVHFVVARMSDKFPWLKECVKQFDVTSVSHQYNLTKLIKETNISVREISKSDEFLPLKSIGLQGVKERAINKYGSSAMSKNVPQKAQKKEILQKQMIFAT